MLAPWGTILTPREHLGGPWEQQDGHEGVRNKIFIDLGFHVLLGLVSRSLFVPILESESGHSCTCFRIEGFAFFGLTKVCVRNWAFLAAFESAEH